MHRRIFTSSAETNKRKTLRLQPPKAELVLWQKLKNRQLLGYKFRRQHSVGRFVVDFYCPETKLAVEVDGDSHFLDGGAYDKERQGFIEGFGLEFLRFTNTEVLQNTEQVVRKIAEKLNGSPSNSPSGRGRGRVLVFGVFDGIHDGHRALFRQARKCGDYLMVAVAQDCTVERLKGHLPQNNLARRIDRLREEGTVDEVVLGDAEIGTYEVIKKCRPSIVALGYDQIDLKNDLENHLRDFNWKIKVVVMNAHKPETHHSSKLNRK